MRSKGEGKFGDGNYTGTITHDRRYITVTLLRMFTVASAVSRQVRVLQPMMDGWVD